MTKAEKKKFIRDLVSNIQTYTLSQVERMPEGWDGIELRWFLADKFTENTLNTAQDRYRQQRKRDYQNEVVVRNL